ncbi:2486_t:CDS:2 [Gigaspora rosea]|nr:2486_t:CDS:2 [Gigaspora rosea]
MIVILAMKIISDEEDSESDDFEGQSKDRNRSFNISRDQENSSLFSPIAINPTSSSVSTAPYNSTSSSVSIAPYNSTSSISTAPYDLTSSTAPYNSTTSISTAPYNLTSTSISAAPYNSTSTFITSNTSSRSANRWTSSETRMLIDEVGSHQEMLKNVRDPREKGRIWDMITSNIQTSDTASLVLKERTKASIQQKWDALLQKYRDIKDRIASTGEEAIQNDWEFFDDMDIYLKRDPSVTAPITSDSICGIKRKVQESTEDQDDDDIQGLIKEQTEVITEIIRDQYLHASEMQQKHHDEQMDIFKQFLLKF